MCKLVCELIRLVSCVCACIYKSCVLILVVMLRVYILKKKKGRVVLFSKVQGYLPLNMLLLVASTPACERNKPRPVSFYRRRLVDRL